MQKKICKQAGLFKTRQIWTEIHMHSNSNINMHKERLALSLPHAAALEHGCVTLSVVRRKIKTLWTLLRCALFCLDSVAHVVDFQKSAHKTFARAGNKSALAADMTSGKKIVEGVWEQGAETELNSVAFSPQANYIYRATAACRRS
jgi:hypothetical protein